MEEIGWRKLRLKKSRTSVRFFQPRFSSPISPIAIAGPSNTQYCVFVQHFWQFFFHFFSSDFRCPISLIAIAGPWNLQYCFFVQHFWEFKIFKNEWQRCNIANSRDLRLWWVNSQNCWTKIQYHESEDLVIAVGGNWVTKITAEKIKNVSSIFSATIFVTQFPPLQSQDPRIRNIVF